MIRMIRFTQTEITSPVLSLLPISTSQPRFPCVQVEYQNEEIRLSIEMKSVNHRYCDVYIRLPRHLSCFEDKLRSLITSRVSRGKIDVFITWENIGEGSKEVILDKGLARAYYEAIGEIAQSLGIRDDISASSLARFPEILHVQKKEDSRNRLGRFGKRCESCC